MGTEASCHSPIPRIILTIMLGLVPFTFIFYPEGIESDKCNYAAIALRSSSSPALLPTLFSRPSFLSPAPSLGMPTILAGLEQRFNNTSGNARGRSYRGGAPLRSSDVPEACQDMATRLRPGGPINAWTVESSWHEYLAAMAPLLTLG
jgi:hypothetical protein